MLSFVEVWENPGRGGPAKDVQACHVVASRTQSNKVDVASQAVAVAVAHETHVMATLAWWPMRPGSSSPDRILNLEEEPHALGNIGLSPVVIVASQAIIALRDVGVAPHELLSSVSSVSAIANARPEIMEANIIRWLQSPLRRRKAGYTW
ncbi:hypothetical protein NL676_012857 [Syzygium grande]|nr:hypothetical protein NL676_012857 [Syzygium grande]